MVLLLIWAVEGKAQGKVLRHFKMPANVEYTRGRVLVKVKDEYKDQLTTLTAKNTRSQIKDVGLTSADHLVKPELDRYGAARKGARAGKPAVDISKYFSITFDRAQNVEDYINQLYATGYFEIVEPEYNHKVTFQPNDPSINSQYYLGLIKAFDAWDITQGDTTIVIAIVDSGGNLSHSDISPNLYRNWQEYPPNGVDDDGNGYIDDYQGWDFMGSDSANIHNPNFIGDNDPSITKGGDMSHGTWAAGCASASTNNGKGIAGVGFKTKLLFTKHTADNQKTSDGSLNFTYLGILYAANQGDVKIINCSFGGSFQSQIIQDIINYAVLDRNCLVVAAAGNDGSSAPSYPAAYDNVLSVAATDRSDVAASFSNYGTTVDIAAPGVSIYTTGYNNVYNTESGTSFSSPIVAGAAALVWAKNKSYTALQVAEQLRVSADAAALYGANPSKTHQLGKGRLDIKNALTLDLPSIRASNPKLVNQNGLAAVPGDKAYLSFDFKNYLKSTSAGLQISISTTSLAVTISKSTVSPGAIAGGTSFSNKLTPFELTISSGAAQNTLVDLLITYSDGAYSDYQYASFFVNPSFIDVNSNQINTTVTGIGRLGYQDPANSAEGSGFIFNQNYMLYEMGLIMGTSSSSLYNNVRAVNGNYDQDFSSTIAIKQATPGARSYSEVFGEFSNSVLAAQQAVVIDYRSMVMKDAPYDKFVIMEYKVKNPTANALTNFYFGIFADWDITDSGQQDAANWDNANKMGYVHPASATAIQPYAGIQLLTGLPAYYAIDNDSAIAGKTSFGIYDGFSDAEKFQTISATIGSGKERLQTAAQSTGDDVSHVVSSGPYNIPAGQTITIAFALHAAPNLTDLKTSARYADTLYNYTMQASVLQAQTVSVCYNTPATLNATGATSIKWYNSFTGGSALTTGTQLVTGNLQHDTTFYVSNADHSYESVRAPIAVKLKANPTISVSRSPILCQGDTVTLSVAVADSTLWSTGQKTSSIKAFTAGKYAVKVKDNTLACLSKSDTVAVTVNTKPKADFSTTGDLLTQIPINFIDKSTSAVSWFWNFGDGQSSTLQNPVHTYAAPAASVSLTVTAANNCTDTKASSVNVVTALENTPQDAIAIYPNPFKDQGLHVDIENSNLQGSSLVLTNSLGQIIYTQEISTPETHAQIAIPSTSLPDGVYVIRLNVANRTTVRRVIKVQ